MAFAPSSSARTRRFVDLSPLRDYPAFARLWIGSSISGVGYWVTTVAVGLLVTLSAKPWPSV